MSGNPRRQHVILVSIDVLLLCRLAGLSALAVQELPEYPTLVFGAGEQHGDGDHIVVFGIFVGLFAFLIMENAISSGMNLSLHAGKASRDVPPQLAEAEDAAAAEAAPDWARRIGRSSLSRVNSSGWRPGRSAHGPPCG